MRIAANVIGLMLVVVTAGCMPMPTVALEATPADLEMLAGEWQGEYTSAALGRRGSIAFKLVAGEDYARGDVLMIPQGSGRPYERDSLKHPPDASGAQPASQLLTIKFVRASYGAVSGMLDSYWDPDRNCYAHTVFRGHLALGIVEGTFTTNFDCGAGQATGDWKVTRKPASKKASARR